MFEFGEDGLPIGRDPRTMTHAEQMTGFYRTSPDHAVERIAA
jgi:hypothetical protein